MVLDLRVLPRKVGLSCTTSCFLISLLVTVSILVPPGEDPRGVSSQAGNVKVTRTRGHLLRQNQLSWRDVYQAVLSKHSQDSGTFHTSHVISAGQAFGTCRLQHDRHRTCFVLPKSVPIQSVQKCTVRLFKTGWSDHFEELKGLTC